MTSPRGLAKKDYLLWHWSYTYREKITPDSSFPRRLTWQLQLSSTLDLAYNPTFMSSWFSSFPSRSSKNNFLSTIATHAKVKKTAESLGTVEIAAKPFFIPVRSFFDSLIFLYDFLNFIFEWLNSLLRQFFIVTVLYVFY